MVTYLDRDPDDDGVNRLRRRQGREELESVPVGERILFSVGISFVVAIGARFCRSKRIARSFAFERGRRRKRRTQDLFGGYLRNDFPIPG